ncbi:dicarboxylate/amino acid:cation symporter [Nevskia sp.]|uniref:dicarboxylate/amino acid:cation symporter n=1 Tax=Nevskia sp. TaxID=1929292 RepID=UPI0025F9A271|nr:dicarboxylate/amino acid:cation symporter [Nevskia sp.]
MKPPLYKLLYVQVIVAIACGALLGHFAPADATALKPLGDGFIKLIKMIIAPIIFCTIVSGIAGVQDLKKVGRVGGKALLYFEVVSTFALAIGLVVANLVKPGAGFNVDPATLDPKAIADYTTRAHDQSTVAFLLNIIPETFVSAFARGEILQVLLLGILFGFALAAMGERGKALLATIDDFTKAVFGVAGIIMKAAPVGAFGAMAFTIGKYGVDSLAQLGALIASVYGTSLLFVFVVLGAIAKLTGFSLLRFLGYIKEELLIVLGTSSSESALPRLMQKLEKLGASKSVVGLVVPTGYSFNLDGTNIYMTMAALFIAQAMNVELTLGQELTVLGVAMLTSKGATGVTGAGFVTLAATLQVIPTIPVAGMALILGVDRFMSECRALTNFIGNGVAALVIARWEGELDRGQLAAELRGDRVAKS